MARPPDFTTLPNGRLRFLTGMAMLLFTFWPFIMLLVGETFFESDEDAGLMFASIVLAVQLLIQLACFASMYIVPPRAEEQGRVETFTKLSFVLLMLWCFECRKFLPGSPGLRRLELFGGLAVPVLGCWVILRVPHPFVSRYSEEDKEDDDLQVYVGDYAC